MKKPLAQNGIERFSISPLDLMTLLYHVHKGSQYAGVGFEDSERTLKQLTSYLGWDDCKIRQDVLESCLWSANLLDERNKFWSPRNETFEQFVERLIGRKGRQFDRFYNLIMGNRVRNGT